MLDATAYYRGKASECVVRESRVRLCASNCKAEDGYWRRMLVGDSCYFARV